MELVDRYLQAVRFWLPKDQKKDIVAELSEDLQSQIEEQEAGLGRELNQDELAAIVKKFGPPMMVAQRYLPQRYLIGPNTFPIYKFVLKLNWMCVFGPWFVVGLCLDIFVVIVRNNRYDVLTGVLDHFWLAATWNFIVLTIVFALLDYLQPDGLWQNWNPQKLPPVRNLNRIPLSNSIAEIGWYSLLFAWWVGAIGLPSIPNVNIASAGFISRYLYWPILVLMFLRAAVAAVNAFRPWWTPARARFRGVVDVLSFAIVSVLLTVSFAGGSLVTITSAKLSAAEIASGEHWITWAWIVMFLLWAEIGYLTYLIQDVRRATGREPVRNWAVRLFSGE